MINKIIEQLSNLTILETVELANKLEKKWNISLNSNIKTNLVTNENNSDKSKSSYDICLKSVGGKRIKVISLVKEVTGLGLKEAKSKVDSIPTIIKSSVSKDEAELLKKKFKNEGAEIELK